ncbi:CRISPR-associated endoribonuclease Cas6 [Larkinella arboricola]
MQFRLTLRPTERQTLVPFNYAYRLSAFIYAVLADADASYARFLHEQGYEYSSTRRFKLFTFSDLIMPGAKADPKAGGIWVNSPYIEWVVSFYLDKAAQHFIIGLFQDQRCVIATPRHRANPGRAEFIIERVEAVPLDIPSDTVQLRTLSPVVIAEKDERGMDQYIHPADTQFGPLLISNLLAKWSSVQRAVPAGASADDAVTLPALTYRLLPDREPRSRLVTIKEGSRAKTQVRGYYGFTFELSGPRELLELAVLAGVGRYNAEGFGCVGVI